MTVIVGVEARGGGVVVGGDSLSSGHYSASPSTEAKVFRVRIPTQIPGEHDEVLIGCTSSWRFLQILKHRLRPPIVGDQEPDVYMATGFSDAVRQCLATHGWAKKGDRSSGGFAVVGFRGGAYLLQDEFDVTRPACGYVAVGAGEDLASGALAALTQDLEQRPTLARAQKITTQALRAACLHSPWCELPLVVEVGK